MAKMNLDRCFASNRYMLSRAAALTAELQAAYENYQFARFYQVCLANMIRVLHINCHSL